jgi:hypothetical protein
METFDTPKPVFLKRDLASGAIVVGNCTPIAISSRRSEIGKITCFVHGSSVGTINLRGSAFATGGMTLSGKHLGASLATYRVHVTRKTLNHNIFGVTKNGATLSTYNLMAKATAQLIDADNGLYCAFATRGAWTTLDGFEFTARPYMRSTVHVQVTMDTQANVDAGSAHFITPSGAKLTAQGIVDLAGIYSHIRASVATLTPTELFAGAAVGTLNPASFVDVLL